ncbi:cyclopropane-fatty-acyl-phospholipid synthase family protein [Rhizobiaceae bacterium n13]|uniref:Cyclopropane-fatty-acyl-phospholipid synthase family protein n=1 Tax=Ferirhizobium litorale TaxID=2927786 RepID=A0AAE3QB46_9HYPH|nr:cyclopropane-fatty-acyl-phospholipid synthase family protein [Fererhizobium litorale]MDI7861485.1 cyclopropane-fatty-acyl-phospholipid synthase family protein [Fererhizobium litorale]MDI7921631.1 cyclopropane-fatty-acyl-phospholipid synthase family protein [Fererhizobium litorale]
MAADFYELIRKIVRKGSLKVTLSSGQVHEFGDGSEEQIAVRLADEEAERLIAQDPTLKLGEMYMDGRFILEAGNIFDFLSLVARNGVHEAMTFRMLAHGLIRVASTQIGTRLPINRNLKNVSHHYDLSAKLFDLFLDEDWQYSCAYFEPPGITLDEAQLAKKRHVAAKLMLEPGNRVLEIGSGWGGLGMYIAEAYEVDVTGITLSEEQLKVSRDRAAKRGLSNSVRFELQDYRKMNGGTYDRIVSVGMFEHVGVGNYGKFFRTVAKLLDKHGIMVLHSIGRTRPYYMTNPFIEKYIFPGGYIPSVAEVLPAVENAGLLIKDVEILPMHYAYTLRHWRERFVARKEEAIALYDERFFRMWEFYLAGSEVAFRHDRLFIFQLQLARHQDAVPFQRGYIAERETKLRAFEKNRPPLEKVVF